MHGSANPGRPHERVLMLAPTARDAAMARSVLADAGFAPAVFEAPEGVAGGARGGGGGARPRGRRGGRGGGRRRAGGGRGGPPDGGVLRLGGRRSPARGPLPAARVVDPAAPRPGVGEGPPLAGGDRPEVAPQRR